MALRTTPAKSTLVQPQKYKATQEGAGYPRYGFPSSAPDFANSAAVSAGLSSAASFVNAYAKTKLLKEQNDWQRQMASDRLALMQQEVDLTREGQQAQQERWETDFYFRKQQQDWANALAMDNYNMQMEKHASEMKLNKQQINESILRQEAANQNIKLQKRSQQDTEAFNREFYDFLSSTDYSDPLGASSALANAIAMGKSKYQFADLSMAKILGELTVKSLGARIAGRGKPIEVKTAGPDGKVRVKLIDPVTTEELGSVPTGQYTDNVQKYLDEMRAAARNLPKNKWDELKAAESLQGNIINLGSMATGGDPMKTYMQMLEVVDKHNYLVRMEAFDMRDKMDTALQGIGMTDADARQVAISGVLGQEVYQMEELAERQQEKARMEFRRTTEDLLDEVPGDQRAEQAAIMLKNVTDLYEGNERQEAIAIINSVIESNGLDQGEVYRILEQLLNPTEEVDRAAEAAAANARAAESWATQSMAGAPGFETAPTLTDAFDWWGETSARNMP